MFRFDDALTPGGGEMLFVNCVLFCLMLRLAVDAPGDIRTILEQRRG